MTTQGTLKGEPRCPTCGRIIDGFTAITGERAIEPGDYSVCGYCAAPLQWDGVAYSRLIGPALVLARLNADFLVAEMIARRARDEKILP